MRLSFISVSLKALLTLVSLPLWGVPLVCTQTSLADYINLTEGCTVDNLLFSNFGFTANTATSNPDTDDIVISPLPSIGGEDWTGIRISHGSGQFLLSGPDLSMDFEITFRVTSTPLNLLYAASLFGDPATTDAGNNARVREFIDYGSGQLNMQINQGNNGPEILQFPFAESIEV